MTYLDATDCAAFIAAAAARRLSQVILAWQQEYGQVPDQSAVEYRRLQRAVLLAYDGSDGCIVRCVIDGEAADRAALRAVLTAAGLEVEERSRNLIGFHST
jgi:hypothetical protein